MSKSYKPEAVLKFRGRTYVLFRRGQSDGTPFSFRVQKDGKRKIISTGSSDLTLAKSIAKGLLAKALDGVEVEPRRRAKCSTLGELLDAFAAGDQFVRKHTANNYENCLLRVIEKARGVTKEEARKLSLREINEDLARTYQATMQGGGSVDFATPRKINTSINSMLRQARGVFSRRALTIYERADVVVPAEVQGFLKAPYLRELSHRYSDNPIPKEQIEQMNTDLPALKEKDERLWAIHLMIRLMGLRDSEIVRARRHWLVRRDDGSARIVINRREGEAAPKRSDGEVAVPSVLMAYFDGHGGDFLIPAANATERAGLVYKEHSKWVRERVPGRTKTNHELRKWAGSVVATKTNSWERAAEFLRIDIETAKKHYLAFTSPSECLSLSDLEG